MNKFLTFAVLVHLSTQACLNEAALKALGFTKVKTEAEKLDAAEVCPGIFAEHGICVDIEELK